MASQPPCSRLASSALPTCCFTRYAIVAMQLVWLSSTLWVIVSRQGGACGCPYRVPSDDRAGRLA